MKLHNIVTPKSFRPEGGEEKTVWLPVGTLRETDDGKRFIEWNATPDITYLVVASERKGKADRPEGPTQ